MILIGLGANLPSRYGSPRETLEAALAEIERRGARVVACSRWWKTAPVPVSDQPWYVNGVARVETGMTAAELLALLHDVEREFGRVRGERNAARVVDLDLLAYGRERITEGLEVPHPRLAERAFVLLPLAELAPDWVHPVTGKGIGEMIAALPPGQTAEPVIQGEEI
ncbi:2-amino-4-hydroxy-6-hydroxymethyldihydropteridine diphosphokinase [Telmatospirillum sp. J64-1]|uniref:2-amino-4-hydroxy-6- hydroxymethyldihydropteridine diphosphokinase n=1 Tax=Telmatospirillum sp. J64-1 TaxID=2502183 RepID=UPI00115D8A7D|nr:2-amino-4-hydroxy-6-hydroxymethyldihydropteridine diphosphokinase [Telmatospirillum sp. J64-1]